MARNTEVSVQIKKTTEGGKLVSPFGSAATTVAYLLWDDAITNPEKPRMPEDKYQRFIDGETVTVYLSNKEDTGVQEVILQCGDGGCCACNRESLTADRFYEDEKLLLVPGKIGSRHVPGNWVDVPYNFLEKNPDNAYLVRGYLIKVWSDLYDIKPDDADFIKKLHDLDEAVHGKMTKPQQPAQPQPQPTGVNTDIQSDETTGYLNLGNGIFVTRPDILYQVLSKFRAEQGTDVAIDKWAELIAKASRRAIGTCVSAAGNASTAESSDRKLLNLLGYKAEAIDALFGKATKDGSDKGEPSNKDKDGKKGAEDGKDDEEFKSKPYKRCLSFGPAPKIDEGDPILLENIRGALVIVKDIVLDKDSSKARMHKFATVWDTLQGIIDEAAAAGRADVGMTYLHYKLGKINSFMLEFSHGGADYELCFGEDE